MASKSSTYTAKKIQSQHIPEQFELSWIFTWVITPLMLVLLGLLFYIPSLNYAFQFDDLANITKFFNIRNLTFKECFFLNSRWITLWLNAVNYRLGTFEPFYYRLFNVLFHVFTSLCVFAFTYLGLTHLKKDSFYKKNAFYIAFFTSALFLLHPTQTQTVSYIIQGRLEGLAGLFVIGLGLCFLSYAYSTHALARWLWGALCFVIAALACGTKEISIVSPALVVLTDWFFVSQGDFNDFKKRWLFHLMLFICVMSLYMYYLKPEFFVNLFGLKIEYNNNIGNTITENRTDKILPLHYFISEFKVILHYLGIFIWPFNISVDYDWKMVKHFFAPDCFFPFCILILIFVTLAHLYKKNNNNLVVFGMLWFFIAIAPRASFMPSTELLADYKTYLASFGWLFVLACGLTYLFLYMASGWKAHRLYQKPIAQCALLTLLMVPVGFATYQRNKVWRSAEEFWGNILQNAPGRARVHNNYGVALSEQSKYKEAIPYYIKATRMDTIYPDPWNNLAVAYSVLGKLDQAIEALKQSLRINPYYPEAYNNLASFLIEKKDFDNAEKMLNVAIELRPHYGKAYYNKHRTLMARAESVQDPKLKAELMEKGFGLIKYACTNADFDTNLMGLQELARVSMQLNKHDDAINALTKMLALNPTLNEAVFLIGNVYLFKKDYPQATTYYQEMIRRVPRDIRAWNNLGEVYYLTQNYQAAVPCFTKAVEIDSNIINCQLRLAECLERTGQLKDAARLLQNVLKRNDVPDNIRSTIQVALNQVGSRLQG